ncbi:MAG: hypothetical protein U1E02_38985, partial [Hydrogenophaga sp.]|nr:hypothetical protein [Hydrogenophaga sp.]
MDVAAHHDVGPRGGPGLLRGGVVVQAVGQVFCAHDVDGLVHHDHAQLFRGGLAQLPRHRVDLFAGDLAVLVAPGA